MKIAIVGTAPTSNMHAPYNDPEWTIWSLGNNYDKIPRWDLWFEFHSVRHLKSIGVTTPHFKNMADNGEKLVLMEPEEEYPLAKIFPRQEIIEKYGSYFTSTIAWLLGLAIHSGADEIGLWGINMASKEEYLRQRAGCEYLIGLAQGKGIGVTIAENSPILKAPLYPDELATELENRAMSAQQAMERMRDQYNHQRGACDMLEDMRITRG